MTDIKWGIDLGGTKIEGVLLKIKDNKPDILLRKRIATESQYGYDHILHRIQSLINDLQSVSGYSPDQIGIGTPGSYDPTTLVHKNSNTTCLNGRTFKSDLEQLLQIPVSMANDANCFAVAEATLGAVPAMIPDARVVFGIIMGTGVGGGVAVSYTHLDVYKRQTNMVVMKISKPFHLSKILMKRYMPHFPMCRL